MNYNEYKLNIIMRQLKKEQQDCVREYNKPSPIVNDDYLRGLSEGFIRAMTMIDNFEECFPEEKEVL